MIKQETIPKLKFRK